LWINEPCERTKKRKICRFVKVLFIFAAIMVQFENNVKQFVLQNRLFQSGSRILVALSGGADSVALLRVLHGLGYAVEAAHCNFHLRGEESMRDETFVRKLTERLGVPLHVENFDTADYARRQKISVEMAARELRYRFFDHLCDALSMDTVCVAHHRDDNAETILLNLIRGTGIRGLTGMSPRAGRIARPFLCTTREEIIQYLKDLHQDYVTDSTNLETEFKRNKVRLQILPLMRSMNPSLTESLNKMAEHLKDAETLSGRAVEAILEQLSRRGADGTWSMSIAELKAQAAPKTILFNWLGRLGFSSAQTENVWLHIDSGTGAVFSAANAMLLVDRGCLRVKSLDNAVEDCQVEVNVGQSVNYAGMTLTMSRETFTSLQQISRERHEVTVDADKIKGSLTLRKVRKGDRFHPFGMKGSKLLSDFFTDLKLSRFERENKCVLCSGEDIVWLVGLRMDQRFAVNPKTTKEILTVRALKKQAMP